MQSSWAHFVGICGPAVGGVAVLLKNKGWRVTGSDQDYYPPASDYLIKNKIEILEGFDGKRINKKMDMVVLGGGAMIMDRKNPEVLRAKELKIKTLSWPRVVQGEVVKKKSIIVAGTYGKTTTTSMIAWILKKQGMDPSYLIGGYANNFKDNVYGGNSEYSVVEGDEHPAALYFDNKSKFLYYKPKYVLITSAKWDHFNIFPKEEDYIETYIKLVRLIPKDGLLILSRNGENLDRVVRAARCKVIWYSDGDFRGSLQVIGKFNRENAAGAHAMCGALNIKSENILRHLKSFRGVKRRLENRKETETLLVVEDFAQHPYKVSEVLKTLKDNYPKRKLILVFDPYASILRNKNSLPFYKGAFDFADTVLVRRIKVATEKSQRVTGPEIISAINLPEGRARYLPIDQEIIDELSAEVKNKESVIVFCSSGGWNGLIERLIRKIS